MPVHRPAFGGDELRCTCGSDLCIPVAGLGVWSPAPESIRSGRVTAEHVHEVRPTLLDPTVLEPVMAGRVPPLVIVELGPVDDELESTLIVWRWHGVDTAGNGTR